MTEASALLQPAFILQQRNYRETSLIMDVFTRDFGRVSVLAKGVRKAKSRTAGLLQPFTPLLMSYFGKGELKTLTAVEIIQPSIPLKGLALYCGFYMNELIRYFLHPHDPHRALFSHYRAGLNRLADAVHIEVVLRNFELDLLENAGYGLQLDYDARQQKPLELAKYYRFDVEQGPVEATNGPFSGQVLLAIKARTLTDTEVLRAAKVLMRTVIDTYLQGKPLQSRAVINSIMLLQQSKQEISRSSIG
jgi:DNA repair protein RecO (recombination protein O)